MSGVLLAKSAMLRHFAPKYTTIQYEMSLRFPHPAIITRTITQNTKKMLNIRTRILQFYVSDDSNTRGASVDLHQNDNRGRRGLL